MVETVIRCPKCSNMCTFADGRLFSFCNKCGSRLERDVNNNVTIYDISQESDDMIQFAAERFEICKAMNVPTRTSHDIESLNYEIERMMDEFMTFSEVLKDVRSEMDSMDDDRKLRICELCFDMSDRIFMQFEQFLKEYNDFGMYDELKAVRDSFSSELQKLSNDFNSKQKAAADKYWQERPEEYKALKDALDKANLERAKVTFFDFERKWQLDAEIEKLKAELNRTG